MYAEEHPCETPGCECTVPYDDEPHCFKHSPDSGSYVQGYSWKRKHAGNYYCQASKNGDDEHVWDDELTECLDCGLLYSQWSEPMMEEEPME